MTLSLITFLAELDSSAMLFLNGLHSDVLDPVMLTITNKWLWISLSALLCCYIMNLRGLRDGLIAMLFLALAIAICDQLCSSLLRPAVERLRPSNPDNPISQYIHIVNGYRSGPFGFPSAHASTTMAVALFLSLVVRRRLFTVAIVAWMMVVCYSRIYLGVHYPGDILVGLIIGSLVALGCYFCYRQVVLHLSRLPRHPRVVE